MVPVESKNKLLQMVKSNLYRLGYDSSKLQYVSGEYKFAICVIPPDETNVLMMSEVALILRVTILNALIQHKMRVTGTPISQGWYLFTWNLNDISRQNEKSN
jgi:hypothetical protein